MPGIEGDEQVVVVAPGLRQLAGAVVQLPGTGDRFGENSIFAAAPGIADALTDVLVALGVAGI